jgi:hypothetical protein
MKSIAFIAEFMMKYLFVFLLFWSGNSFSQSINPGSIEKLFQLHAMCSKAFVEFDYGNIKDKNKPGAMIYEADYKMLKQKYSFIHKLSMDNFGKKDTDDMVASAIIDSVSRKSKNNLSQENVQKMIDSCREWLYQ